MREYGLRLWIIIAVVGLIVTPSPISNNLSSSIIKEMSGDTNECLMFVNITHDYNYSEPSQDSFNITADLLNYCTEGVLYPSTLILNDTQGINVSSDDVNWRYGIEGNSSYQVRWEVTRDSTVAEGTFVTYEMHPTRDNCYGNCSENQNYSYNFTIPFGLVDVNACYGIDNITDDYSPSQLSFNLSADLNNSCWSADIHYPAGILNEGNGFSSSPVEGTVAIGQMAYLIWENTSTSVNWQITLDQNVANGTSINFSLQPSCAVYTSSYQITPSYMQDCDLTTFDNVSYTVINGTLPNEIDFNSLFIGHSFFRPLADGMPFHAAQAGIVGHSQSVIFSSGATGAPQALWENANKRTQIQTILDGGDIELFGMTYHGDYPTSEGYENWIEYALEQNPNTRFTLALPWGTNPGDTSAETYASAWHDGHSTDWHDLIDTLRTLYPGVDIFCIPYGQSALELRLLFSADNLPDVDSLVSGSGEGIYSDDFGHADNILIELGRLVWLNAIYDVNLTTYAYDPGYITDLKGIAQSIMDAHDTAQSHPNATGNETGGNETVPPETEPVNYSGSCPESHPYPSDPAGPGDNSSATNWCCVGPYEEEWNECYPTYDEIPCPSGGPCDQYQPPVETDCEFDTIQYEETASVIFYLSWYDSFHEKHCGTIQFDLHDGAAPIHSQNFRDHAAAGNYDGVIFHRVIDDFMIQAGDFQNGDGTGGYAYSWHGYCNGYAIDQEDCLDNTSYSIPDETNNGIPHIPGALSMAHAGPNTGGSQFFIVDAGVTASWLDGMHTVFGQAIAGTIDGQVVSGIEVVDAISQVDTGGSGGSSPYLDVTIISGEVIGEDSESKPEIIVPTNNPNDGGLPGFSSILAMTALLGAAFVRTRRD